MSLTNKSQLKRLSFAKLNLAPINGVTVARFHTAAQYEHEIPFETENRTAATIFKKANFYLWNCKFFWKPTVYAWTRNSNFRFFLFLLKIRLVIWDCKIQLEYRNRFLNSCFLLHLFPFIFGYVDCSSSDWFNVCSFCRVALTSPRKNWTCDCYFYYDPT